MASLIKRPGSPFHYLLYKKDGVWKRESTGLRLDDPNETAEARSIRAQYEAQEHHKAATVHLHGWDWVTAYFQTLGVAVRSLEKYSTNWNWVSMWLEETKFDMEKIEYSHVEQYILWRTTKRKRNTGKLAGRNTAIQEIKLLAFVMNEGVRRGFVKANPLASLRQLRGTKAKRKPELTDDQLKICLAALNEIPDTDKVHAWMKTSFKIALHTGCRLRETRIPLSCVHLDSVPTITFPNPKGGEESSFSIPIPDALLPMFRKMKREKREWTIDAFPAQPSRMWQQFFERLGLHGYSFHCLRVTKVTRLRREGVPREVAMRLVNHSSELMHMLYDRHQVRDLVDYRNSGKVPSVSSSKSRNRNNARAPQ